MATYKVLQDIEAEDKLVGPLTLRQFIYGAITAICLYISFILLTKHAYFVLPVFLLPALVCGFFAFPWGREQPTEIWALAKIRFMILPRRRIWNQSGVKEMVTVTAPKRAEVDYTNGLSQTEVSSRLRALADTIDTRGWATKNVNPAIQMQPSLVGANPADSDRLVGVNILPAVQSGDNTAPSDDMLDEQNSPVARQFDQMLQQSNTEHRQRVMQEMAEAKPLPAKPATKKSASAFAHLRTILPSSRHASAPALQPTTKSEPPNDYWFMSQPPTTGKAQVVAPGPTTQSDATVPPNDESVAEATLNKAKEQPGSQQISYGHLRTIQPISDQPQAAKQAQAAPVADATSDDTKSVAQPAAAPVTPRPNPATLKYVNNDDLSVATIARQVNENPPDEIVISLH